MIKSHMFYKLFTFILLFLSFVNADSKYLTINDKSYIYDKFQIYYLDDQDKTLTINDIKNKNFSKTSSNGFSLGYTKGYMWLKIDILNKSQEELFILSLNETFYEKANLYYKKNDNWIKKENSLFTSIKDREVKFNKLSFEVPIPKNEKSTVYVQIQGKYSYFGKVEIYKKDFFNIRGFFNMNIAFIFIFGITFIIFVFSIGMYVILKEKIYLYYCAYTFFNFIYLLNISGLLVYVDLQKYIYSLQSSGALVLAFLLLFSLEYLNIKHYLAKYYKLFRLFSIPYFLIAIVLVFDYRPWNQILNFMAEFLTIFLIVLSIVVYFKGFKKSKYYTLTITIYLIFVVLFLFMLTGVMEYDNLTRYGLMIGSAIENIIFSMLIISRYHDIKDIAQNKLENEVIKRTKELHVLNEALNKSDKEKSLLLRELYHRVKNNFHMIMAMLWLEGNKSKNNEIFEPVIDRIESMSMVHEYLYNAKKIDQVDVGELFHSIVKNFKPSPAIIIEEKYSLNVNIQLKHAISLGMIVNEIITNSLKHNQEVKNLKIIIEIYNKKNQIFCKIEDNGKGFDKENHNEGIGLTLVKDFCRNLYNEKHNFISNNKGTLFELSYTEQKGEE